VLKPLLPKADVIILGPGIGTAGGTEEFVSCVFAETNVPMVIDADALNVTKAVLLKKYGKNSVITPHPMEMSRLSGVPINEILADPLNTAKRFASEYGVVTLLKGKRTVIASPSGKIRINTTGNSALAKAGTGDVLSGIIAALIAQGMGVFDAASIGSFIHGLAGDMASGELSQYGVTASDVIGYIPKVLANHAS
jgi:NAD(P)H-hydrate epimerase